MRRVNPVIVFTAILLLFMLILAFCIPRGLAQGPDDTCLWLSPTDESGEGTYAYFDCPTPVVSPSPTATPTATNTPSPTPTATNTPTPTTEPEPTQEIPCVMENTADGPINVRTSPQLSGLKVGEIPREGVIFVEGYYDDPFYRWLYFHWLGGFAWTANLRIDPNDPNNQNGWYTVVGSCNDLIEMHPLLDGPHLLIGASENVLSYLDYWGTAKSLTHSDNLTRLAKEIKPSIVIVYRSLYNCHGQIDGPLLDEQRNADLYWECLRPFLPAGPDYYEIINEWGFESRAQEADWHIRMLELMAANGKCGLAFSDGPGNPEIPAWNEYIRVLRWIDENPCGTWPSGRLKYHGVALHQSGKLPDWVPTLPGNYSKNVWVYNRHQIVDLYLRANFDYSLEEFKGPIYITEMGFQDYTIPNEEFTCSEVRAGLDETRALYQLTNIIDGFHLWNFWGATSTGWVDLTHCLPELYS